MAESDAFRKETRGWLEANAPESLKGVHMGEAGGFWGGRRPVWQHPDQKPWLEMCAERGLTCPSWPTEYGGAGLSRKEAQAWREELRRMALPRPLVGIGPSMIGPAILRFATEEQKQQHLPALARGEIRWCQGYSEPDAGSDLASLSTRAVRDGDDFIITGQKVWTTYGDLSDWIFALVRDDPKPSVKQEGITFILIDMESPGVSVAPIKLISGKSPFCETRFEEVRVPIANVIGEIGAGWTVAKALLGHEREMAAEAFGTGVATKKAKQGSALRAAALKYIGADGDVLRDRALRHEIAQNEMDTQAYKLSVQRSRDAARAKRQPGPESSMFKLYGSEVNQRRLELLTRIAGPQGLGWEGPGFDEDELTQLRTWLHSFGNTIEGGTSEINRNIIAKRVLHLPD